MRRNTEMSIQRLKKLSTMIKLGNIEGLDYLVTKWQWQYDDIKFENLITPLILAVMSNQLPMVQFLVSQGVEMDHVDLVGRSAIDWSISCNYETIYYFLKSSVTKTASSTASSTSSQSLQSVQIREVETVVQNRSFKSSHRQSQQAANQRVVAFYDDSPEMRNPRRATIDYEELQDISVDTETFEKDSSPSARRSEPHKVADHLSPLTQSSTGNASLSVKKSPSISSRQNRPKQMKTSSGTQVKPKEKVKIIEDTLNGPNEDQMTESASKKDPSPDSVRKWMTKRIVAAAEAVIPTSDNVSTPYNKPRYTRSLRKATSKAFKFIWKKKLDPKTLEN